MKREYIHHSLWHKMQNRISHLPTTNLPAKKAKRLLGGYVYLVEFLVRGEIWTKVGSTVNPQGRVKTITRKMEAPLIGGKRINVLYTPPHRNYSSNETLIHNRLKMIANIAYDECYPLTIDEILTEFPSLLCESVGK